MPDALRTRTMPDRSGGVGAGADAELDALLDRVRLSFAVEAASIRLIEGGARLACASGPLISPEGRETAFCRRVLALGCPVVIADTALDGGQRPVTGAPGLRFYAGVPLIVAGRGPIGTLCLLDSRPRSFSGRETGRLAELAATVAAILRLGGELAARDALVRAQAADLAHTAKIFEAASAAARIGVWECDLRDEALTWSGGVYDIFEMPRDAPLDRLRTLACYSAHSRTELEAVRSRAIAERGGFTLDAEITSAKGHRRWIRLTATVECEGGVPLRIFGMKQDITEEKLLSDRTRYLAEFDVMTGLANRGVFQARLARVGEAGCDVGALMLVDLDGFKRVNDTYGHALGDACLAEAAARLAAVCEGAVLVARIGGDEFGILLGAACADDAVAALAARIVEALGRPMARGAQTFTLGASVGSARAEGASASELFTRADSALYAAKAAGRNTFRAFDAALADPRLPHALPDGATSR